MPRLDGQDGAAVMHRVVVPPQLQVHRRSVGQHRGAVGGAGGLQRGGRAREPMESSTCSKTQGQVL